LLGALLELKIRSNWSENIEREENTLSMVACWQGGCYQGDRAPPLEIAINYMEMDPASPPPPLPAQMAALAAPAPPLTTGRVFMVYALHLV